MPVEVLKMYWAWPARTTINTWWALSTSIRSPTALAGFGRAAVASFCRVGGSALPVTGRPSSFWKA